MVVGSRYSVFGVWGFVLRVVCLVFRVSGWEYVKIGWSEFGIQFSLQLRALALRHLIDDETN